MKAIIQLFSIPKWLLLHILCFQPSFSFEEEASCSPGDDPVVLVDVAQVRVPEELDDVVQGLELDGLHPLGPDPQHVHDDERGHEVPRGYQQQREVDRPEEVGVAVLLDQSEMSTAPSPPITAHLDLDHGHLLLHDQRGPSRGPQLADDGLTVQSEAAPGQGVL